MYDLSIWPYSGDAIECFREALAFTLRREDGKALLSACLSRYRDGSLVDWATPLTDLGALAGKYGISAYTMHFILYVHLLAEAERKYSKAALPSQLFLDTFDDLRVKCEECERIHKVYGTFVAPWLAAFFTMTRFGFGRLEAEVRQSRIGGEGKLINIHIPSKGKLVEKECEESYQRAQSFFGLGEFACDSWLLNPIFQELGGGSGIVRFASRYRIAFMSEDRENRDAWRIFGTMDTGDISALPEDTRLQRIAKNHLLRGGSLDRGYGRFSL